jgi:hypothetical protein
MVQAFLPVILLEFLGHSAGPLPPSSKLAGFRLFRFRSPLLTESLLISFPVAT